MTKKKLKRVCINKSDSYNVRSSHGNLITMYTYMYVEREERGRGIDVATKLHGCIQLIMTFVFGDNGSKLWDLLKPTLLISSVCS